MLRAPQEHHRSFEFNNLRFSVQVFTFENVYGLDRDACVMTHDEHTCTIHCEQFTWAGGQQHATGSVTISAVAGEGTTTFAIEARQHTPFAASN